MRKLWIKNRKIVKMVLMSVVFWDLVSKLCRLLLSLRYKVRVKGGEALKSIEGKRGVLFLPNHPAHMDPLFLFLFFWPRFRMHPLVIEYIYRLPLLKPLMRLVKALPIPNFDTSVNQLKVRKATEAIERISSGLKNGENFVLYPAGRLKPTGKEVLGGVSAAHALVKECPDAHIVLVRTSGFWGSSFSRAILGRSPDLPQTLFFGLKTILKNLIFFSPRREVVMEIELDPESLPKQASRLDFNRYLENWYNRYPAKDGRRVDVEPLNLVSYSRWSRQVPEVFQPKSKKSIGNEAEISDEIRSKIYSEIRRILSHPGMEIRSEQNLATDLGLDSLNIAELMAFIAKTCSIDELHPEDLETVQSVLEMAAGSSRSERSAHTAGTVHWPRETNRPPPVLPQGKNLPEAFLRICARMQNKTACGDDLAGVLSYKKMRRACLVLSLYFRALPGPHIAVLLPASVGAYLVILAILFAGKVPVMLNWTLGPRYLEEMMRATEAKTVISSWRFLDRLVHVEFGSVVDKVHLLEDIRSRISLGSKLRGAFLSMLSVSKLLKFLHLDTIDENSPAVILFTSGTEANPKGVPLSHRNILSNQRSGMQCIELKSDDVLYGVLPPFHSFGFSIAGLFPLFGGVKVAFYPDPTDSCAVAEGIARWRITLFCSPPSFLKGLFGAAKEGQLNTVRWFICGAEKAPQLLFDRVSALHTGARLIEGYGITECSPIITIARSNSSSKGVGQPAPDVEVCTIHLETQELLPAGSEGEICVRGPNVFNGYLGNPRNPFIEIDGNRWYRTGDIGHLDPDGNLILSGRLKRFTKLGGEMISLGAIEEILYKILLNRGRISPDVTSLAVLADERVDGKPRLIVFSVISLEKEEANLILQGEGFSRLVKIAAVKRIDEIPLMGTGKTDYRLLQTKLEDNGSNQTV